MKQPFPGYQHASADRNEHTGADCDEHTVTAAGKHACYRQAAGTIGRRSRRCIADARA